MSGLIRDPETGEAVSDGSEGSVPTSLPPESGNPETPEPEPENPGIPSQFSFADVWYAVSWQSYSGSVAVS